MTNRSYNKGLNILYTGDKQLNGHYALHTHLRLEYNDSMLVEKIRDESLTDTTLRWLGDQPIGLPKVITSTATPYVIILDGTARNGNNTLNVKENTEITLGILHIDKFSNDTEFNWVFKDISGIIIKRHTGNLLTISVGNGGYEYALEITANTPHLNSTTMTYKIFSRGNESIPVPAFDNRDSFSGQQNTTIDIIPSNLSSLSMIPNCKITYNLDGVEHTTTPDKPYTYTFPHTVTGEYPFTKRLTSYVTGDIHGVETVSDITTIDMDTEDPSITGTIIITPDSDIGVLNTTVDCELGGVISPSGSINFAISNVSNLFVITPSSGKEITITTGLNSSLIGTTEGFDVTATDGVESMTQSFNFVIKPATELNIDNVTIDTLSGSTTDTPSKSTLRISGATTNVNNPIQYRYLRSIDLEGSDVRGVKFTPDIWDEGDEVIMELNGTPDIPIKHVFEITDSYTVYEHTTSSFELREAIIDISNMSMVRLGGGPPCGVDSEVTYRIGNARSPSSEPIEYSVVEFTKEYTKVYPPTWNEGDVVTVTIGDNATLDDTTFIRVEASSLGVRSAVKKFECVVGIPDVIGTPINETILVSELAHIANPVVIRYDGVTNDTVTEPVKLLVKNVSAGITITPTTWTQGANISVLVDNDIVAGTVLEFTVEAFTTQFGTHQLMASRIVNFTALS